MYCSGMGYRDSMFIPVSCFIDMSAGTNITGPYEIKEVVRFHVLMAASIL
jgi:hypothetical protein